MSEIASDRANKNAQDLRDLQDTYRKRKQEIEEKGESDVAKSREKTARAVAVENEHGDAVVNHIREKKATEIRTLQNEADQRMTYERRDLANKYESSKQKGITSLESLEKGVAQKKAALERENSEITRRTADARAREAEVTEKLSQDQSNLRKSIQKDSESGIAEIQQKASEQKQKIRQQSTLETTKEVELQRAKMQNLKDQNTQTYQKQSDWSAAQLKAQSDASNARLEADRKDYQNKQTDLKLRTQSALSEEKNASEARMKTMTEDNRKALELEREKGTKNMDLTQQYFAKEIARIHKDGDTGIAAQTEQNRVKFNELKEQEKAKVTELKTNEEKNLAEIDDRFKNQAKNNEIFYKQALIQQRSEFEEAHNKNQKAFDESVRAQKARYAQSLENEKREVMQDVGKFSSASQDPFYRMNQLSGSMQETDSHYIITAQVPEHEKDNVRIVVKDDKVIVQGSRRYKDQVKQDASQISTENYQTYREVIPLERPVQEKFARHSYANGVMTVKIPKA